MMPRLTCCIRGAEHAGKEAKAQTNSGKGGERDRTDLTDQTDRPARYSFEASEVASCSRAAVSAAVYSYSRAVPMPRVPTILPSRRMGTHNAPPTPVCLAPGFATPDLSVWMLQMVTGLSCATTCPAM